MNLTPKEIQFFRENPGSASKYLFNSEPLWYQQDMLNVANNARISMWIASRGIGKTWEGAIWLAHGASLYNDLRCCVYAKDFTYTKATFEKLDKIYETSPFLRSITYGPPKIQKEKAEFRFKNGSIIYAEPFKRGKRWNLILLDEAREIDLSDFSTVILPMLSDPHPVALNRILLASSATYHGEPLHRLYQDFERHIKKGSREYGIANYSIYDAKDSPYYDNVMIQNAKRIMLEEEFQIEFENKWVNLAGGWIRGALVRSSERDYKPELFGKPGFCYTIGVDFGRVTNGDATSITVNKIIPNEGVAIVRNYAVSGMPIPDQAMLIKQFWRDFGGKNRGEVVSICLDNEKLGYAVCDSLALPSADVRDGEYLPPIVGKEDYETQDAIRVIVPANFADKTDIWIRATKMKKGFELGNLFLPKDDHRFLLTDSEKSKLPNKDREILEIYEEIAELKREICNVELVMNGGSLNFKRNSNRDNKKDRFTSAFLSSSEAIDFYDELGKNSSDFCVGFTG